MKDRLIAYLRCKLGFHFWTNWRTKAAENFLIEYSQVHRCKRCKYTEKVDIA